jgi:hypothetical protein
VISRITEKNLTPKAKAAIVALLDPGEYLADASLWADENRRKRPKTAPWRYVDVPLDEPRYRSEGIASVDFIAVAARGGSKLAGLTRRVSWLVAAE